MAGTEVAALIIALIALFVAFLQVSQQFLATAFVPNAKVGPASIGGWARRNKRKWLWKEMRIGVWYARPEVTASEAVEKRTMRREAKTWSPLSGYVIQFEQTYFQSPEGMKATESGPHMKIVRKGHEDQRSIPLEELPWRARAAALNAKGEMSRSKKPPPCRATWVNLLNDIGTNLDELVSRTSVDAESIPSSLDSPPLHLPMAEVVKLGLLLDMQLTHIDIERREIDMIGEHCTISSQNQQSVGMVTRYSGLAPSVQPPTTRCSSDELVALLQSAQGMVQVGRVLNELTSWGYNAVYEIFGEVVNLITDDTWTMAHVSNPGSKIKPDTHLHWRNRWRNPTVPVIPFLLGLCGNMAVANSFPHCQTLPWRPEERKLAMERAWNIIQNSTGFELAPHNILEISKKKNIVLMDGYKVANDWGCHSGGLRGWLTTNFAEFAVRISECWEVKNGYISSKVPILTELQEVFAEGTLSAAWARDFDKQIKEDEDRDKSANGLLWLQTMMLDTWIGRKVELIMKGGTTTDPSIPIGEDLVRQMSEMPENKVVGARWRRSRLRFVLLYLQRLAEGVKSTGASCMTRPEVKYTGEWREMGKGEARDWAEVDAVLTLRAATLAARLELMKDSSMLTELRLLNPIIQLA